MFWLNGYLTWEGNRSSRLGIEWFIAAIGMQRRSRWHNGQEVRAGVAKGYWDPVRTASPPCATLMSGFFCKHGSPHLTKLDTGWACGIYYTTHPFYLVRARTLDNGHHDVVWSSHKLALSWYTSTGDMRSWRSLQTESVMLRWWQPTLMLKLFFTTSTLKWGCHPSSQAVEVVESVHDNPTLMSKLFFTTSTLKWGCHLSSQAVEVVECTTTPL